MKQKFEASKARNKVLANENKSFKTEMQKLVDKGQHDDELISALIVSLACDGMPAIRVSSLSFVMMVYSSGKLSEGNSKAHTLSLLKMKVMWCLKTCVNHHGTFKNNESLQCGLHK